MAGLDRCSDRMLAMGGGNGRRMILIRDYETRCVLPRKRPKFRELDSPPTILEPIPLFHVTRCGPLRPRP